MAASAAESAIRNYLMALKDPASLRDDNAIEQLRARLEASTDELERLQLRQQLFETETPTADGFEDAFATHAKAWAEQHGVTARSFEAEGVAPGVLRRAGFTDVRGGRRGPRRGRTRTRVTKDEVRSSIPRGSFTIKGLQERSGASVAVVRDVVSEELKAKRLKDQGTDPDHKGPGRAPTLYKKSR